MKNLNTNKFEDELNREMIITATTNCGEGSSHMHFFASTQGKQTKSYMLEISVVSKNGSEVEVVWTFSDQLAACSSDELTASIDSFLESPYEAPHHWELISDVYPANGFEFIIENVQLHADSIKEGFRLMAQDQIATIESAA